MYILSTVTNLYKAYLLYNNFINIKNNVSNVYNGYYEVNNYYHKFIYNKFLCNNQYHKDMSTINDMGGIHDGEWEIVI